MNDLFSFKCFNAVVYRFPIMPLKQWRGAPAMVFQGITDDLCLDKGSAKVHFMKKKIQELFPAWGPVLG